MSRNVFNPGVHHGLDGFKRFAEQIDEMWERFELGVEELIDAGNRVVAGIRVSGVGRGSGVEVDMHVFNLWTLREGKVLRFEGGYRDRSEACEAAGLPKG